MPKRIENRDQRAFRIAARCSTAEGPRGAEDVPARCVRASLRHSSNMRGGWSQRAEDSRSRGFFRVDEPAKAVGVKEPRCDLSPAEGKPGENFPRACSASTPLSLTMSVAGDERAGFPTAPPGSDDPSERSFGVGRDLRGTGHPMPRVPRPQRPTRQKRSCCPRNRCAANFESTYANPRTLTQQKFRWLNAIFYPPSYPQAFPTVCPQSSSARILRTFVMTASVPDVVDPSIDGLFHPITSAFDYGD
ncbi:hypothetical protein BH09MYX1_BH09MYX1_18550 [soil metagenome]